MTAYQLKLKDLLIRSTLCTGRYTPSEAVKHGTHSAVLVDGVPVYLSGPSEDAMSLHESEQLAQSQMFALALLNIGISGDITHGIVKGVEIDWQVSYSSVVRSEEGQFEDGQGQGELVGINLTQHEPLTVFMCVNDSIARIFDPQCPSLDNGNDLAILAKLDLSYSKMVH